MHSLAKSAAVDNLTSGIE